MLLLAGIDSLCMLQAVHLDGLGNIPKAIQSIEVALVAISKDSICLYERFAVA
jgi:hypothetical protein